MSFLLRDAVASDHPAILALNLAEESLLSPMDAARLVELEAAAAVHRVAVDEGGAIAAFLLAFREGAEYDSPNYRWFADRYERFLYVDRIAVSAARQGLGLGAAMYADLFALARASDVPFIVCEYYSEPLNENSRRFHARQGFVEVGSQALPDRGKTVSYLEAPTRAGARG